MISPIHWATHVFWGEMLKWAFVFRSNKRSDAVAAQVLKKTIIIVTCRGVSEKMR